MPATPKTMPKTTPTTADDSRAKHTFVVPSNHKKWISTDCRFCTAKRASAARAIKIVAAQILPIAMSTAFSLLSRDIPVTETLSSCRNGPPLQRKGGRVQSPGEELICFLLRLLGIISGTRTKTTVPGVTVPISYAAPTHHQHDHDDEQNQDERTTTDIHDASLDESELHHAQLPLSVYPS